jgi:hypothetical protein
MRKIFGPKGEEVVRGWRRLYNEDLHNLYASPNIIRVIRSRNMRWAGHVANMGEMRNSYKSLVGKPEGRRPHGRPRHRWEDIRMNHREIWCESVHWINLAQVRDQWQAAVNMVMNLHIP